jgi:catechol 2,3-dioxygenase
MTNDESRTYSRLIDHIHRVDLRVRNIGDAVSFYRDIVGLHVLEQDDKSAALGPPEGPALLVLNSQGVDAPASRNSTGLFHTAFLFPDRASLGDALARALSAGREIGAGDHGVSEALYLDDPDGNGIEMYRDRPRDQWPSPAPGERVRMYTEPVDLRALFEDAGHKDPVAPLVGHVHLQVGDVGRTVGFYAGELGLDLTARLGGAAAFFSSNEYHHHVGGNAWNSRGGAPAPQNHAGLERVVFTAANESELERLEDRLMGTDHAADRLNGELSTRDPDGIELRFTL